jgi:hypothetical protein
MVKQVILIGDKIESATEVLQEATGLLELIDEAREVEAGSGVEREGAVLVNPVFAAAAGIAKIGGLGRFEGNGCTYSRSCPGMFHKDGL